MAEMMNNQGSEIEEVISRSEDFVTKYKWHLLGAIAAIVLIVVGVIYYNKYTNEKEDEASAAFAKAWEMVDNDMDEQALNGDSISAGLIKLIDQYSGTDQADLAKVRAAQAYVKLGKFQEAIPLIEGFDKGDQMITPAVKGMLGECYANVGQIDKAIDTFKKAAKMASNNSVSPHYLIEAGLLLESQGKKADALKLYQEVKEKYINSMYYQEIDKYIERVK
ncbi:MAG: tetratricopeptide repeat protein [Bacteroidaceae bacterium]|nr:tetratricopeptide repeat protein [Bacteroidaceae bacterium]